MGAARSDGVVGLGRPGGAVVVGGALGVLVIEDAVGVHAHGKAGLVLEVDHDPVADLGLDDRPQQAQVLPLGRAGLEPGEAGVGVFAIQGFDVNLADAVRALLDKDVLGLTEGLAGDVVAAQRRIVPADLVGGNVIGPGPAAAGRLPSGCQQAQQDHQTGQQPERPEPA